jgi:hypothetical protein
MLKSFKYTKANGNISHRTVYPIGVQDDKLFTIDLTDLEDAERHIVASQLEEVHKRYIADIVEVVGSDRFRLFFFEGIA